jgi:hypothetical protein
MIFRDWLIPNSIKKIGFEDMQIAIRYQKEYLIINTLSKQEQDCLIQNTLPIDQEEKKINERMDICDFQQKIILYGKNSADITPENKYKQLSGFGFTKVYIYSGGLFEWLLLQDIYGEREFPTTKRELDLLKFRPNSIL